MFRALPLLAALLAAPVARYATLICRHYARLSETPVNGTVNEHENVSSTLECKFFYDTPRCA